MILMSILTTSHYFSVKSHTGRIRSLNQLNKNRNIALDCDTWNNGHMAGVGEKKWKGLKKYITCALLKS